VPQVLNKSQRLMLKNSSQKHPYLVDVCLIVDGYINLLTTHDLAVIGLITNNAPASPKQHGINNNPCINTIQHLTHQSKQIYYCHLQPFVWDYSGEPVPEKTFTYSHPSQSSIINHPPSASSIHHDPQHPPCSIYMTDSHFAQPLSTSILVHLPVWHRPIHTFLHPIAVFFSQQTPTPMQPISPQHRDYVI